MRYSFFCNCTAHLFVDIRARTYTGTSCIGQISLLIRHTLEKPVKDYRDLNRIRKNFVNFTALVYELQPLAFPICANSFQHEKFYWAVWSIVD